MNKHKSISLADIVFERLENEILGGKYAYGEVLTEARLCEEMGVSRTPIREAIRRLEQENILRESGKGMVVQGITAEDIADILDIRVRIEGIAARRAAEKMTPEQKKALVNAVDLQEFYVSKADPDNVQWQDHAFHEMIYEGCGSTTLQSTLVPLHRKAQKFRRASVEKINRAHESTAEHRRICVAILAGDGDAAEAAMNDHLLHARESMIGQLGID